MALFVSRIQRRSTVALPVLVLLLCTTGCSRPEVPGAPDVLSAEAGNGQVTLSWRAPVKTGGSAITSYLVSVDPGGSSHSVEASTQSLTLPGLANGTLHTLSVSAVNAVGEGPPATTTAVPATVPSAPTVVSAVAGVGAATVSWSAPTDNGGSAVTHFHVTPYVGTSPQPSRTVAATSTGAQVTGLSRGTTYTFTVIAQNEVGLSPASLPSNATATPDLPGVPTGVSGTRGNGQVQVSWIAPVSDGGSSLSGHVVTPYLGATALTPVVVSGGATSIAVTGLSNGTAYTFKVAATNAVGTGLQSAPSSSVTPATVPGAPIGVTTRAGNAEATVAWQAPGTGGSPITGYTVIISPGGGTVTTALTTVTLQGLTNGQSYTLTVTASNSVGTGASSPSAGPVIPGPAPSSCAGALQQNPSTASGVFSIEVQGTPLDVYCDMTSAGGGWTLVYKLSGGVDGDAAAIWSAASPLNDADPALLTLTPSASHYLSRIVTDHWNTGGMAWAEARVAVYSGGAERAFLQLNASGSTRTNWFALPKVTAATWTDLNDGQNYFGIDGDWAVKRNWFINNVYSVCSGDVGWLVVSTGGLACTWETTHGAPVRILYAPGTVRANWTTAASVAEVLAVFVR